MASTPNERPNDEVVHHDELASLREEVANLRAENAELRNREQVQMESLTASLAETNINGQHAGRHSTSSRPMAAAAIPVNDGNPVHGGNTNSETQWVRFHRKKVKITTEILCELVFTPEELSSQTLTGTGKGKGTKAPEDRKLDENKVSAIVDAVQKFYPGQEEKVIKKYIAAILSEHQQCERGRNE